MIFIDMDGVLAKWEETSIEETFKPGYFARREVEGKIAELIHRLMAAGKNVAILSAVYTEGTAWADKESWLKSHGLGDIPRIFVPYGEDKNKYIVPDEHIPVLVDDFSKNLHAWTRAGYRGVKFYNGINGHHGTWTGYSIDHRMTVDQMYTVVKAVAEA